MAKDILIGDDGDLVIENGDFKVGDSNEQHVVLLINTQLGAWKQFPLRGVGIILYSASSGQQQALRRIIVEQMTSDGFSNVEVTLKENGRDTFNYYITADRIE